MTFLQQEKWYSAFSWSLEKVWHDNIYDEVLMFAHSDKYCSFVVEKVSISHLKISMFMSSKTWLHVIIRFSAQLDEVDLTVFIHFNIWYFQPLKNLKINVLPCCVQLKKKAFQPRLPGYFPTLRTLKGTSPSYSVFPQNPSVAGSSSNVCGTQTNWNLLNMIIIEASAVHSLYCNSGMME